MSSQTRRIAVNTGGEYVPGMNTVIAGVTRAADELGWEVVGVRDGYEGLLFRDRYPHGGVMKLTPERVDGLATAADALLGTSHLNPFRVQELTEEGEVDEADRSDDLLEALRVEGIDGLISIVGRKTLSLALKLDRKGLKSVCIPKSSENDIGATALAFGFNSTLGLCIDLLDRIRAAARSSDRIAVVEVPGDEAGWLALQAAIAVPADAALIPEIPFDLDQVAARLQHNEQHGRPPTLVVVSEGARRAGGPPLTRQEGPAVESMRRALSAESSGDDTSGGRRVINRHGVVADAVALGLQHRCDRKTFPVMLGHLLQGGQPGLTDRQVGQAYGAAAVRGLHEGKTGTLAAFQPDGLHYVPLVEAVNGVRRVNPESELLLAARALGISLGD